MYDYGKDEPKIKGFIEGHYWSGTEYAGLSLKAWNIYFCTGSQNNLYKTDAIYVRCVRTTKRGKLKWKKHTAEIRMNWDEAMKYAGKLNK
jgi:hypothetical protein